MEIMEGFVLSLNNETKMRGWIVRIVQVGLAGDGILHLGSFGMAIYENAMGTAFLTGLQTLLFFTAMYFVGHDHSHHHGEQPHE